MEIKCKFCDNPIPFHLKLSAADTQDELAGYFDSINVGDPKSEKVFDRHKDPQDWPLWYMDKFTKNIPWRNDVMPLDDDTEVSNVAHLIGQHLIVKCGHCKRIYAEIPFPESNDTNHYDSETMNPANSPIPQYQNTQVKNDYDRPNGNINIDNDPMTIRDKVVRKLLQKNKNK